LAPLGEQQGGYLWLGWFDQVLGLIANGTVSRCASKLELTLASGLCLACVSRADLQEAVNGKAMSVELMRLNLFAQLAQPTCNFGVLAVSAVVGVVIISQIVAARPYFNLGNCSLTLFQLAGYLPAPSLNAGQIMHSISEQVPVMVRLCSRRSRS
jgi:hypothetical protein